jgi:hypothetical protein
MVKVRDEQVDIQFFAQQRQTMEQANAVQTTANSDNKRQPLVDSEIPAQAAQGAAQAFRHGTGHGLGMGWRNQTHATDYSTGSEHATFTSLGNSMPKVGCESS